MTAKGVSEEDLIEESGMSQGFLKLLLVDEVPINGNTAVLLSETLSETPQFWMELSQAWENKKRATSPTPSDPHDIGPINL